MVSKSTTLRNIRNLFPYFLLVAIYFFFVNLEAGKEQNKGELSEKKDKVTDIKATVDNQLRIKIPVIPFKN
tara:strand:- start:652 stop:864 length:213 start_codon:yes stop_codon:yes gene_type:complete